MIMNDYDAYNKYLKDHDSKFLRTIGNWQIMDVCPMDFKLFLSHVKIGWFKKFYKL